MWDSTSSGALKQPTMLLQVAATRHRHLLPMAYPQSSLANDLAMGSLPLPWENATKKGDAGPTMPTASSATSSRTTLRDVPTSVATADITTRMTCVRNHTFIAHGTSATSCGP